MSLPQRQVKKDGAQSILMITMISHIQNIATFVIYGSTAVENKKQTKSDPVNLFLLVYPPTLSNAYSKRNVLDLSMDELLTVNGILLTSGYSSVPQRHMY